MSVGESLTAIIVFALAGLCLVLGIRHFSERGFLLNNAYIHASAQARASMNKKPYYRQSAVVLCLLGGVFTVVGLSLVMRDSRITLLEIPLIAAAFVYAAVSSARINRRAGK